MGRHGLAIDTGCQKRQLMRCLGQRQAFNIGPRIPVLALTRGNIGLQKRLHPQITGGGAWAGQRYHIRQRHAGPRHSHSPRFNTAVTIKPFLKSAGPRHQCRRIQGHFGLDKPVNCDCPRVSHQFLGAAIDIFCRPKFIKIRIGGGVFFRRNIAVKPIGHILWCRIAVNGRQCGIAQSGQRASQTKPGKTSRPQPVTPVHIDRFRRHLILRNCP